MYWRVYKFALIGFVITYMFIFRTPFFIHSICINSQGVSKFMTLISIAYVVFDIELLVEITSNSGGTTGDDS